MYVYIDESGDTGYKKKSSRYFITTAIIVDDIFTSRRITKYIHNFKKDKSVNFHTHKENSIVKNKLAQKINESNIKCVAYVFDKDKLHVDDIYKYSLEKLAEYFSNLNIENITVARKDIRKFYNRNILEVFKNYGLSAIFSEPNKEKSLQIADFYSWSIFSNFEFDLPEYFLKLKNSITIIKNKAPDELMDYTLYSPHSGV